MPAGLRKSHLDTFDTFEVQEGAAYLTADEADALGALTTTKIPFEIKRISEEALEVLSLRSETAFVVETVPPEMKVIRDVGGCAL